jgi:hypothetical protein
VAAELLLWIRGRDRDTGQAAGVGLCEGADDLAVVVDGETRTYAGGGGLIGVEPVVSRTELAVQMQRITLSALHPAAEHAVRGIDPRLGRIWIHVLHRDPVTGAPVGLEQRFRGTVDAAPISTGAEGEQSVIEIAAASAARELTRPLSLMRSDASQRRRSGDRFLRHAAVGLVRVWWRQERPS